MNEALLHTEVQDFIHNYTGDIAKLAFAKTRFSGVSNQELVQQIQSRRTIEKKLPQWFTKKGVYYPPKLNLEQTSSEAAAKYKASLVQGSSLADITGGFGIDAFFFSQSLEQVSHFEINKSLSKIAAHNSVVLQQKNITYVAEDGLKGIAQHRYDTIYVDPSRRNKTKGKVFFLRDCEPNVPEKIEYLLERCNTVLVKTSPMLDLSVGLDELKYVASIHVVSVRNEVKELLWTLTKKISQAPTITAVSITSEGIHCFSFTHQLASSVLYDTPKQYLYEPNAALLKAGAFQQLSEQLNIAKLHQHSHLYTSEVLIDFPGRRFKIEHSIPYNKKAMRDGITFDTANITTRNFPESVATLRKKWKLKEGGNRYLFFTTLENEDKILLICAKV